MALSLVYEGTLSRVRITGTWPPITDTFTRTVSNGWGTSDSGHAWTLDGGVAADYSTNGSVGRISVGLVNAERRMLVTAAGTDQQIRLWSTVPVVPTGAPINWGAVLRWQDTGNYYWVDAQVNTDSTITLRLVKRVAGTATQITTVASGVTHSTTVPRILKAQIIGDTIKAKLWASDGSEPTNWQLSVTDSNLTAGTQVGAICRLMTGNTNTLPVVVSFDNVRADQPEVTVQRSTNQVTWSTVRGGTALPPVSDAISLDDYEFAADVTNYYRAGGQSGSITPVLDGVVLKSLARPFLNRTVTVVDWSDVERVSRSGVFPIVGRSFPVAVTDLHGSRQWTLDVVTQDAADAANLDLLISTGEVQFVHVPADCEIPGGYVALGDTSMRRPRPRATRRIFALPFTECAQPGPDVIPAVGTWQSVINTYATWTDVLAAHPTWESLLQLVGSPADVVVP